MNTGTTALITDLIMNMIMIGGISCGNLPETITRSSRKSSFTHVIQSCRLRSTAKLFASGGSQGAGPWDWDEYGGQAIDGRENDLP